ncbi:MAG: N-carbamoyl-L-amino acid amidohydrolase [Mariprofundus sp.]
MFIKIDKKTHEEAIISSEEMVSVLEADLKDDVIDDVLTEIVTGAYKHSNASAIYTYKS